MGLAGTFHGPVHVTQRPLVTWPHRVGVVPPRAHCYEERPLPDGPQLVLCGPGGVGKTQLAAALATRAWEERRIDLLVWLTASSRHAVLAGYAQAAADVIGADEADPDRAAGRLLAWLAGTDRRWLVVLDNLVDPGDLRGLWPPVADNGRAVVTTWRRDAGLAGAGRRLVDVGLFTPEQSVGYLTRRLAARPELADDPAALAGALGHLPLALAQAAAYLLDRELTCAAYRALLADRGLRLDDLRPEVLPDDHERAVAATWSLSTMLADQAPHPGLAEPLLRLAGVLDPNGIPGTVPHTPTVTAWLTARRLADGGYRGDTELVRRHLHLNSRAGEATTFSQRLQARVNRGVTGWLVRRFAGEPVGEPAVTDTVRRLHLLSLAVHDPASDARALRVHALVQRATREAMSPEQFAEVVRVAADALIEGWSAARQVPEVGEAFYANIEALTEAAPEELWHGPGGPHMVLMIAGDVLLGIGQARAAADHLNRLAAEARRRLGPESGYTLGVRQTLSAALGRAGDQAGAVAEIEAVYADAKRFGPPNGGDLLAIRHNLATAWFRAGQVERAAAELESLVDDCVAVLGPYDRLTLYNRHQLAHLRGELGDAAGAVAAYRALLVDGRRLRGSQAEQLELHVRVQLAHWHGRNGDAAAAVTELETLIGQQTPLLGPYHRRVLGMRHLLAHWHGEAGDPAGAVAALETLLADWLRVQAPDSPDTMTTRQYLARWRGKAGDPAGAIAELEELLADQLRVLSADHPDITAVRSDLDGLRAGDAGDPA